VRANPTDSGRVYVGHATERERFDRRVEGIIYGERRVPREVVTPERIRRFWWDEIRDRLRQDKDAVIVVWGPPGSGKSTMTMDALRHVDPTFTPNTLAERVAMAPEQVPSLYRHAPRYGAAWIDEGGSAGLLATDTFNADQKKLVELINIIRGKNVALFICLPDPGDLAKSFRARRADYRIECEEIAPGGTGRAWVGRRVRQRKFFLDDGRWLGFSDDETFNPITWPDYRTSTDPTARAFWDAYAPLKATFMDGKVEDIERSMNRNKERREARDDAD
jgi:hypothetical protein